MHTLDWKHAWTGRLLTTAPTRPQALKLLSRSSTAAMPASSVKWPRANFRSSTCPSAAA
ncbi:MAG: hypothetical protein ACLSAH_16095 [Bilophila wadsworthia]